MSASMHPQQCRAGGGGGGGGEREHVSVCVRGGWGGEGLDFKALSATWGQLGMG